jgi:hypothetical protein
MLYRSRSFVKFFDFFLELVLCDVPLELHGAGYDSNNIEGFMPESDFFSLLEAQ